MCKIKKEKILKKNIFLFSFLLLLLYCSNAICAAITGRANWVKSGNNAHISFSDVSKQARTGATVSCSRKYAFEGPIFERKSEYSAVYISGLDLLGHEIGAPILPCKPVKLLIPYMQKIAGINIILGPKQEISGTYNIEHVQRSVPLSQIGKAEPTPPNPEIYSSNDVYPSIPAADVSIQGKSGYGILLINLFPVEYYPLSGKIAYYKEMTIQVETVSLETAQSETAFKPDPNVIDEIRSMVDNPETLDTYKNIRKVKP